MPNADVDSPDELFQHNIVHTNMDQLMDVMKLLVSASRDGRSMAVGHLAVEGPSNRYEAQECITLES